jgi:hypothetical protein
VIFSNRATGADVFVDANTLVYHFALQGFTSPHVVAETAV